MTPIVVRKIKYFVEADWYLHAFLLGERKEKLQHNCEILLDHIAVLQTKKICA